MPADKPARTTISLNAQLYEQALRLAARRGFDNSFSAYVAWLIKRDAEGAVEREYSAARYGPELRAAEEPHPTPAPRRRAAKG